MVAILSGSEFQSFIAPVKNEIVRVFAVVNGIESFAIEVSMNVIIFHKMMFLHR